MYFSHIVASMQEMPYLWNADDKTRAWTPDTLFTIQLLLACVVTLWTTDSMFEEHKVVRFKNFVYYAVSIYEFLYVSMVVSVIHEA